MSEINVTKETITLYSKQLRLPTFNNYDDIIRQLDKDKSYADFLLELLKAESLQLQENNQKRRIKAAKYPYVKTIDEFDLSRLKHVKEPFIWELAGCDYIDKNQNVVMIGNPGTGKLILLLA